MSGTRLACRVGTRPLLAKTCSKCKELKQGDDFRRVTSPAGTVLREAWCKD